MAWLVDRSSFRIPKKFSFPWDAWSALQRDVGVNLEAFKGKNAVSYRFLLRNHPLETSFQDTANIEANVWVVDGTVAGGLLYPVEKHRNEVLDGLGYSLKGRTFEEVMGETRPADAVPVEARAERDGVRLTLRMDQRKYRLGEILWARVRIENTNEHPVLWTGGGCNIPAQVSAVLPSLQARGKEWPGRLGEYKRNVLAGLPERVWFEEERLFEARRRGDPLSCTADLRNVELAAGGVLEVRLAWDRRLPFSSGPVVVPDGPVTVEAEFPLGGMDAPRPLVTRVTVELTGGPAAMIGPGQAVDAALADRRFASWLSEHLIEGYPGPTLTFRDGRWLLRAGRKYGPDQATATIDPISGKVVEVRFGQH